MADDLNGMILRDFTKDIAERLGEAAVVARSANDLGEQGFAGRSFQTLLGIEPLIFQARMLMNAASIVWRRDHDREMY